MDLVKQSGFVPILILLAVLAGAILFVPTPYYQAEEKIECAAAPDPVGGGCKPKGWYFNQPLVFQLVKRLTPSQGAGSQVPPQTACTQEAELCPDGSSVGRTGPNCEFSPCPASESTTSAYTTNWKTYNSDFYSFKLPDEWKQEPTDKTYQQYLNYDPNSPEIKSQPVFDPNTNKGLLKIEIYAVTSNNFKDYLEQKKSSKSERDGPWQESKLAIEGQQAVKDDGGTGFIVYVMHPQKPVIISISFGLDFDNYNALAGQILSTFKFLP